MFDGIMPCMAPGKTHLILQCARQGRTYYCYFVATNNKKRTSKNATGPKGWFKTDRKFTELRMSKLRFQIKPMVQTQGLNTHRQMTKL